MVLLGLLGGIVGEQLGCGRCAVVGRAVEMVRQRVALVSGITAAPEAGGGRDQGRQVAPLARRTSPPRRLVMRGPMLGRLCPQPQEPARALAPPTVLPSGQLPAMVSVQPVDGAKQLAIKKVVVVRSGDTLSRILAQEYGEYTKAVVDLVSEANPGLRNIHFLEIGQRLILPERPEEGRYRMADVQTLPPPQYPSLTSRRQEVEYVVLNEADGTAQTSLQDYLRLFWRRKWLFLLPAVCILHGLGSSWRRSRSAITLRQRC